MEKKGDTTRALRGLLLLLAAVCFAIPVAVATHLIPDPSVLIAPFVQEQLPVDLDPEFANELAFEGGQTGPPDDPGDNVNVTNFRDPLLLPKIDAPTGATPSPLFGAEPFEQKMLRFEECGRVPLGPSASVVAGPPFPSPPPTRRAGRPSRRSRTFSASTSRPRKPCLFPSRTGRPTSQT